MKATHTPGPWQVAHLDPLLVCDSDGEKRGCAPIAYVEGGKGSKANARLIAAAPEMLNALRELVAEWDENHAHESYRTGLTPETVGIAMARRAIAKVEA